MSQLRTVLVDDAEEMRVLLRALLDRDGRFAVVGEASNGAEALDVVADARPDLVVLDIGMPVLDGIATLPRLRSISPHSGIVMLSAHPASEMSGPSLDGGAIGYVEKGPNLAAFPSQLVTLAAVLTTAQQILDQTYASDLRSAAAARGDLRDALAARAEPDVVDVVELLTSELVTNAVRHARSSARVAATISGSTLRVAVTDDGPGTPVLRGGAPVDAESGRGLQIVAELASAHGVQPHEAGKTVWFEVTL